MMARLTMNEKTKRSGRVIVRRRRQTNSLAGADEWFIYRTYTLHDEAMSLLTMNFRTDIYLPHLLQEKADGHWRDSNPISSLLFCIIWVINTGGTQTRLHCCLQIIKAQYEKSLSMYLFKFHQGKTDSSSGCSRSTSSLSSSSSSSSASCWWFYNMLLRENTKTSSNGQMLLTASMGSDFSPVQNVV